MIDMGAALPQKTANPVILGHHNPVADHTEMAKIGAASHATKQVQSMIFQPLSSIRLSRPLASLRLFIIPIAAPKTPMQSSITPAIKAIVSPSVI
jgi:hypothetical protein